MNRPIHMPARPATPPAMHLCRQRQKGVALLEALISILIFSFGVLGLIGLEARAINFSVDAEDRNRAAIFANDIASTMWLNASVTVPNLPALQTAVADPSQQGVPNGQLFITPVPGTNSADIKITWTAPSRTGTDSSQLTTRVILP